MADSPVLRPSVSLLSGIGLLVLSLAACSDEPAAPENAPASTPAGEALPETAREEVVASLQADLAAERHESDGQGQVRLEPERSVDRVRAGERGHWSFVFTAGPAGIQEGGMVYFQVSPFWEWSTPQVQDATRPGYTTVAFLGPAQGEPRPGALELEPATLDRQLLGIRIQGRDLQGGERIRVVYGASEAGAYADRYAESASRFWFAVDGDGDGIRAVLPDPVEFPVQPGSVQALRVHVPSTARRGQQVRVTLALLDGWANMGPPFEGTLSVAPCEGLDLPERIRFESHHQARRTLTATAVEEGLFRVSVSGPEGLEAESNPLLVADAGKAILWADLHGHSHLSDGTGTPEDWYTYARSVAGLDVAALTDHDHWGMKALDTHPEVWDRIVAAADRFHDPGRFVTLPAFEWTSWAWGHRHVLYFQEKGPLLSSLDPATDTPRELWSALREHDAISIPHHPAGGPVAIAWDPPPDPELEPLVEVVSVHGSSEAQGAPGSIYSPVEGHFVRDVLDRGMELGLLGGGDGHDGHPGLAHLAGSSGGLTALVDAVPTRSSVAEALRARRTYATNGPRILLRTSLDGHPVGSPLTVTQGHLVIGVFGTRPIEAIDLVRREQPPERISGNGSRDLFLELEVDDLQAEDYLYLRIIQEDGGMAWTSPWFVRGVEAPAGASPSPEGSTEAPKSASPGG